MMLIKKDTSRIIELKQQYGTIEVLIASPRDYEEYLLNGFSPISLIFYMYQKTLKSIVVSFSIFGYARVASFGVSCRVSPPLILQADLRVPDKMNTVEILAIRKALRDQMKVWAPRLIHRIDQQSYSS